MSKIKAIFIDPDEKKTSIIELTPKNGDLDLEECYKLMDCDLVEFVYFGEKEILIVDEEGLLKEKMPFLLTGVGQQCFCGKALIVQESREKCIGIDDDKIDSLLDKIVYPILQEVE